MNEAIFLMSMDVNSAKKSEVILYNKIKKNIFMK